MDNHPLVTAALKVANAEKALEAAKMELRQLMEGLPAQERHRAVAHLAKAGGASRGGSKPSPRKAGGPSLIDVVRARLAKGPATSGELWPAVEAAGGQHSTLKALLFKAKNRKEFAHDVSTGKYTLKAAKPATSKKSKPKQTANKVVTRESSPLTSVPLPAPLVPPTPSTPTPVAASPSTAKPVRLAFKKPDPETTKAPPAGEGKQG